jgi:hypothetical protein
MTISDDWKKTIRRNKLLGMWAAEKLGITGRDAGVVQSNEQILRVMNELMLQAGNQMPVTRGGGPDALAMIQRVPVYHPGPARHHR